ncbi:MAG: TIGR01620 family protein [Paracoccaceae bacterium]|nr:TIGR01620 family protein [Paracoccaceae bacterium]
MSERERPVLIELDEPGPSPADAPPVAETEGAPTGQAMQSVAALAAREPSRLVSWFWRLLFALLVFFASVAAWDFVAGLAERNQWLGYVSLALVSLFVLVCVALIAREAAALARLQKIERFHDEAANAAAESDLKSARALVTRMERLYAGREDARWGLARLGERKSDVFDPDGLFELAEDTLLAPLDDRATREVEAAARQVAMITALVPLALADVAAALTANLRMIRRIAEIYGGRSGTVGTWRLTRAVLTHLVATGAVAVGDDLLSSIGGGHLLSRISRRFGEGLVNGALTARVGVAAMEVCRPLPFSDGKRPRVTRLVQRALTGLFDRSQDG